jgi:hypothetical protein
MTAEFSDLSALLTQILSPAMPYLLGMAEEAGGEFSRRAGGAMLDRAEALWTKLRGPVEAKRAAREAALDLAADPDRRDARQVLTWQLEQLLEAQPHLADELQVLLTQLGVIQRTQIDFLITGGNISVAGDMFSGGKHVIAPADREPGAPPTG